MSQSIYYIAGNKQASEAVHQFADDHNYHLFEFQEDQIPDAKKRYIENQDNVLYIIIEENTDHPLDAIKLLNEFRINFKPVLFMIFTDRTEVPRSVDAIKSGAIAYYETPSEQRITEALDKLDLNIPRRLKRVIEKHILESGKNKKQVLMREFEIKHLIEKGIPYENKTALKALANSGALSEANCYPVDDPSQAPKTRTVLIIEDSPAITKKLKTRIEDEYKVLTAEDSKAALDQLNDHPEIDIILLDIYIPGTKGHHLLPTIYDINPKVEVIIMTAYDDTRIATESQVIGATDYLSKPFTRDELIEKLDNSKLRLDYKEAYAETEIPLHRRKLLFKAFYKNQHKKQSITNDQFFTFFPEFQNTPKSKHPQKITATFVHNIDIHIRSLTQ